MLDQGLGLSSQQQLQRRGLNIGETGGNSLIETSGGKDVKETRGP